MATPDTSRMARSHRVRPDILIGAGLIAIVTLGGMLWQATDTGILDPFGSR